MAAWALLAVVWAPLLWRLARMWRSEPEQLFGFGVPVLVTWLLWQRRDEWLASVCAPGRGAGWLAAAGGMALAAAALALEANPLWPTAVWAGTVGALALSLGAIACGYGWRAARAAAAVLALMLTALKWPAMVYEPVMRSLMQVNAVIAAELVSLAGSPAVVRGNVIEVARGMVGVDEACSGLRSLQTVVMMAFFLGELDRLRVARRLALLAGAGAAALLVNVARTSVLTWVFARQGAEVEARWHDPAGLAALGVTLALVWWWAGRVSKDGAGGGAPAAGAAAAGLATGWKPFACAAVAVVAIESGTQAWYRAHEGPLEERVGWALSAPADSEWERIEVPRRAAELLRYESGESYARQMPAPSRQLLAFAFRWESDLARLGIPEMHDPLICLPSVGAVREAELPDAHVRVEGIDVPFRFIRFRQGLTTQHVWFCLWNTRGGESDGERALQGGDIARKRWQRVLSGRRGEERQQLIFFVQGEPDDEGAAETLRDAVLTLMRRT